MREKKDYIHRHIKEEIKNRWSEEEMLCFLHTILHMASPKRTVKNSCKPVVIQYLLVVCYWSLYCYNIKLNFMAKQSDHIFCISVESHKLRTYVQRDKSQAISETIFTSLRQTQANRENTPSRTDNSRHCFQGDTKKWRTGLGHTFHSFLQLQRIKLSRPPQYRHKNKKNSENNFPVLSIYCHFPEPKASQPTVQDPKVVNILSNKTHKSSKSLYLLQKRGEYNSLQLSNSWK